MEFPGHGHCPQDLLRLPKARENLKNMPVWSLDVRLSQLKSGAPKVASQMPLINFKNGLRSPFFMALTTKQKRL